MTPLHTDDDQIRRLDEIIRAMYERLMAANGARHDKAAKAHHFQSLQGHARRLVAELTSQIQPESQSQNSFFDLGD